MCSFWSILTFSMSLLLLAMFNMVYCKNFLGQNLPYSYDQIKLKGSTLSSKITNPWKFFKPNNPKGQPRFLKEKTLEWFNILVIYLKIDSKIISRSDWSDLEQSESFRKNFKKFLY